jgi:hypothetical protein
VSDDNRGTHDNYRGTLKAVTGALLDAGQVGWQPEDARQIVDAVVLLILFGMYVVAASRK